MNRSLEPKQHWTIARLAYWYLDRGRFQEAETLARGLLALDRSDGLAWKYYAEARCQQDDYDEAVRGFSEAARLNEEDPEIWMRLGDTLLRLQRTDEARRALKRAQNTNGDAARRRRIDALLVMCN